MGEGGRMCRLGVRNDVRKWLLVTRCEWQVGGLEEGLLVWWFKQRGSDWGMGRSWSSHVLGCCLRNPLCGLFLYYKLL